MKQLFPIFISIIAALTILIAFTLRKNKAAEISPKHKRAIMLLTLIGLILLAASLIAFFALLK